MTATQDAAIQSAERSVLEIRTSSRKPFHLCPLLSPNPILKSVFCCVLIASFALGVLFLVVCIKGGTRSPTPVHIARAPIDRDIEIGIL